MNLVINLPWSKPPLSMNDSGASRGAMFAKARVKKEIRETMRILAMAANAPKNLDHVVAQLHYQPRDRRRRDTDNTIATAKHLFDGLVDYGVVPDDVPEFMEKPEPIIHPAVKGEPGRMWLSLEWTEPDLPERPESV